MDLTPVEQVVSDGNAPSESQASTPVAANFPPALTKTAIDAVPSLTDAIRAMRNPAGSSVSKPETEKASAEPGQSASDASLPGLSGQTPSENSGTSVDGATSSATPEGAAPIVPESSQATEATPPKKPSRAERRRERERQKSEAQAAGTPLLDEEEDDDDFLVGEVQRAVQPLAAKVQELASLVTSTTNPGPVPADVARLNETYIEKFGDDAVFAELADVKVKNSRTLSLEEDERLATWAENRLVRDLQTQKIQRDVSAVALGVATQRGVDAEAITNAPNLAAAFEAFWVAGQQAAQAATATASSSAAQEAIRTATAKQQELTAQITALTASNEELKRTNQQIVDELEALEKRAPAFARKPISGGLASLSSIAGAGIPLDPQRQTGRQMLAAAAANRAKQLAGAGPAVRNR